jgi:hypothetical protein
MKNLLKIAALTTLFATSMNAFAATENVTAEVEFVAPITLVETNALQFGLLSTAAVNTDVVAINSASSVTDTSSLVLGGSQSAAAITVTAAASSTIDIVVSNIVNGTGYALGTFVCNYNGTGETGCSSSMSVTAAASASLLIGATLTADGNDVAGAANGSFDVVVTYQ